MPPASLCALVVLLSAAATAAAATGAAALEPKREQREPTEAELRSFNEFFQQRTAAAGTPDAAKPLLLAPVLAVDRESRLGRGLPGVRGPARWQLSATVDTRPRHAAVDLCHLIRSRFRYAPTAHDGQRWSDDGKPAEYIWLSGGPVPCGTPKQLVELSEQAKTLPASDIVQLLGQQATLLSRARLLFAGSTSCARQRAYPFKLTAIAGAAPESGATAMYALTFRSDRATTAQVTVRKNGQELTAWNVSCAND